MSTISDEVLKYPGLTPMWDPASNSAKRAIRNFRTGKPDYSPCGEAETVTVRMMAEAYKADRLIRSTLVDSEDFENLAPKAIDKCRIINNCLLDVLIGNSQPDALLDSLQKHNSKLEGKGYIPFAKYGRGDIATQFYILSSKYVHDGWEELVGFSLRALAGSESELLDYDKHVDVFNQFAHDHQNEIQRLVIAAPVASGCTYSLPLQILNLREPRSTRDILGLPARLPIIFSPIIFMPGPNKSINAGKVAIGSDIRKGDLLVPIDDRFGDARYEELLRVVPEGVLVYPGAKWMK
jgi:hypothetical protein